MNKEVAEIFSILEQELRMQKILYKRSASRKPKNERETLASYCDTNIRLHLVIVEEKLKTLKARYSNDSLPS